jgi:hypothetical protein
MSTAVRAKLLVGVATALFCAIGTAEVAAQQSASPPNFSSREFGWLTFNGEFLGPPGSPNPMSNDPTHRAHPTRRIGLIGLAQGALP